jgi:hypothetical protein
MLIKDGMDSESSTSFGFHWSEGTKELQESLQNNTSNGSPYKDTENLTLDQNNIVPEDNGDKTLEDPTVQNEAEIQDSLSSLNNEVSFQPNDDEDKSERVPLNPSTDQHSPEDSALTDQNLAQDSTLTDYHSVQVSWIIFLSRGLSAWGDRLWAFGIGIFMNLLGPKDLRLVAVYGFSTSVSIIFFGATIGRWIDRTERLTSAKMFLGIQNLV